MVGFFQRIRISDKNHGDNRISSLRKPLKHHEKPKKFKSLAFLKAEKNSDNTLSSVEKRVLSDLKNLKKASLDKFESKSGIITTLVKFP